jgi:hypothetical protein
MKYIHISSKVESRIETLEKAGKAGAALAQKAVGIIESLASGAVRHRMDAIGSYTKYGEKRIKNCRKYDLGCGYRLITLQRGPTVFVPLLGTHDECQRWLENHSRLKGVVAGKGTTLRTSGNPQTRNILIDADSAAVDEDADDDVLSELTDRELRQVFSGLVEGAKKQPS